jgi:hypothetical protein
MIPISVCCGGRTGERPGECRAVYRRVRASECERGRGLVNTIPSLSLTLKKTACTALVIDAERKGRRECNGHVDLHGVRGERSSWKGRRVGRVPSRSQPRGV